MMALTLLTPPAAEPVALADARAHLRLDATEEDALLGSLLTAARMAVEAAARYALLPQSWRLTLDDWPTQPVEIPLAPVLTLDAVRVATIGGSMLTIDPAFYEVDTTGTPPRLAARRGQAWPMPATRLAGIAIDFTAGHAAAAEVPAPLKQAILLLAAHWFENREPVPLGAKAELPAMVAALIAPYRRLHL
jgi:uncharacterized phiE125 gp8 family phage protein